MSAFGPKRTLTPSIATASSQKTVDNVIHLSFKVGVSPQSNSLDLIDARVERYRSPMMAQHRLSASQLVTRCHHVCRTQTRLGYEAKWSGGICSTGATSDNS